MPLLRRRQAERGGAPTLPVCLSRLDEQTYIVRADNDTDRRR